MKTLLFSLVVLTASFVSVAGDSGGRVLICRTTLAPGSPAPSADVPSEIRFEWSRTMRAPHRVVVSFARGPELELDAFGSRDAASGFDVRAAGWDRISLDAAFGAGVGPAFNGQIRYAPYFWAPANGDYQPLPPAQRMRLDATCTGQSPGPSRGETCPRC